MQNRIEKAKNIKLLILDVDGVLTDGKLFFDEQGREYKSFNARDGLLRGCQLAFQIRYLPLKAQNIRFRNNAALRQWLFHLEFAHRDIQPILIPLLVLLKFGPFLLALCKALFKHADLIDQT